MTAPIVKRIILTEADDIADPCWDDVFKAIFTKDEYESQEALRRLLIAILERELTVVTVTSNEPPIDDLHDRQIRYDITGKFDDGELFDLEMTISSDAFEAYRLEFYSGKLYIGQNIRGDGKTYRNLKPSFQISFFARSRVFGDDYIVHRFRYYDPDTKTELRGQTRIIY